MHDPFAAQAFAQAAGAAGCDGLRTVAADVRALLRAHCPCCQGTGPACIVDTLQETLDAQPPLEDASMRQ